MSTTQEYFSALNERAQAGEFASAAGNVFQFNIEGAGVWHVDKKKWNLLVKVRHRMQIVQSTLRR